MRKFTLLLTSLEIWFVGLCVAVSFFSQRLLPYAVGCAIGFTLVRWVARGEISVRTPSDWPILLLILMSLVSLWATAELGITLPQVLRLLAGIGIFYAIVNWTNSTERFHWLTRGVWLAGLGLALYAFISVQWVSTKLTIIPSSIYTHFRLLVSDTAHPNVMAGNLAIICPCILGVLLFSGKHLHWLDRGLSILAGIMMTGVIILTQSRGGLLAWGEVLVFLVVLRWRRGWLILAGVAVLVMAGVLWFGPTSVLEGVLANATFGGIDGRIEVWSRAIYMIQDFPFTGVGMGSFPRVVDLLYPFFSYAPGTATQSHNLLLQIAVDLGIPGLIAWLSTWILMVVTAFQLYRRGKALQDGWMSGLGAGLLCSQFALMTHGMLDAVTWGMVKAAPLVWVLWGLTVAGLYVSAKRL